MEDLLQAITHSSRETKAGLADTNGKLDTMAALQAAQGENIKCLSERTAGMEQRAEEIQRTTESLEAHITALETKPSPPASVSPPSSTGSSGPGPSDPHAVDRSIVRLGTNSPVSLEAVRSAVKPLILQAGLKPDDVVVKGPMLGKKFVLRRSDTANKDERQVVDLLMEARRNADGSWLRLEITAPTGGAIQAYLNRDASFAQRRVGWVLTRAARALREVEPGRQFDVARAASSVVFQWSELVVVKYDEATGKATATWQEATMRELNIDIAAARSSLDAMVQQDAGTRRG